MNVTLSRIPFGMWLIAALNFLAALGYLAALTLALAGVIAVPADRITVVLGATAPVLWLLSAFCILRRPAWGFRFCLALFSLEIVLVLVGSDLASFSAGTICALALPTFCGLYIYWKRDYFTSNKA